MENVLIPLDTHYGSIIVQCTNLNKAYMYRRALRSTRFALIDLLNMFRYNKNDNFYNPKFYRSIQKQLLDVEIYLKEIDEVIINLKSVCGCGKPVDSQYAPCCSLNCWSDKFE